MNGPPEDDLIPSKTPGYNPTAAKSVDEYAKLDAGDESLARWKASLGVVPGASGSSNAPKVTVLTLDLLSPSLPRGKRVSINVQDKASLERLAENPITIKEGVEYNVRITFRVNHSIISGVRYIHVVKRSKIQVDKLEQMIGSYGPNEDPYIKDFETEESPSGVIARTGTYHVTSRVVDDDNEVYAEWKWSFKIGKEW